MIFELLTVNAVIGAAMMAATANKKSSNNNKKDVSPVKKSLFATGKSKGTCESPSKKPRDTRNQVMIRQTTANIMEVWVAKSDGVSEAVYYKDIAKIREDAELRERLNIVMFTFRRGENGSTPMRQCAGSQYNYRLMIMGVPEDKSNMEGRKELVQPLIDMLNENKHEYKYPKSSKFGMDHTTDPMVKPDVGILDNDIVALIEHGYSNMSLTEVKDDNDIMGMWWTDIEYGQAIIENFITMQEEQEPGMAPGFHPGN
jgi:hypothetical protein